MLQEAAESSTGARLHVNLSFVAFNVETESLSTSTAGIADLLLTAVTAIRVSRGRLSSNLACRVETCKRSSTSGWLLWSSGVFELESRLLLVQAVSGTTSDSLSRHVGRVQQLLSFTEKSSTRETALLHVVA